MYTKMEKERKESNIYKWTCEQTDKRITRKLLTTLGSLQDGTLISEPAVPLCVFWGALESSEL